MGKREAGDPEQGSLFGDLDDFTLWRQEWQGMPEFAHEDLTPWKSVVVHFGSRADKDAFAKLVDQTVTDKTQSIWYPEAEIGHFANKMYVDEGAG